MEDIMMDIDESRVQYGDKLGSKSDERYCR
jgi:hypothetical protein